MHATIPKGDMGYDQFTVSDTVALALFSIHKQTSMATRAILSNFFEEQ